MVEIPHVKDLKDLQINAQTEEVANLIRMTAKRGGRSAKYDPDLWGYGDLTLEVATTLLENGYRVGKVTTLNLEGEPTYHYRIEW